MAQSKKIHKQHKKLGNAIAYLVLIIISIIWLFHLYAYFYRASVLILQSFGGMVNYLLPKEFSLDSYKFLFSKECQFFKWYGNTLKIAVAVTICNTIVVICVSYALSRLRFKGRKALMNFWLVLGMFPGFLTMICLYFL